MIRVSGNYIQSARGTLRLNVHAHDDVGQLLVGGRAELDGILELDAEARALEVGQRLVVLRAHGGGHGRFQAVVARGFEFEGHWENDAYRVVVVAKQGARSMRRASLVRNH